MAKYVGSQRFRHPRLGVTAIRALSTARRVTARWSGHDLLKVTIPLGMSAQAFDRALADLEPRLLAIRPAATAFTPGWRYDTPEMSFEIVAGEPGVFTGSVNREKRLTTLRMPPELFDDSGEPRTGIAAFNAWVNKVLKRYADTHAESILLPLARELARRVGVRPKSIGISYGAKVMGRCNSRGEILLSRNLVFFSEELRALTIMHEFAHLTHLNHSDAFYALLDRYLNGRHAELDKRFRAHRLPFA